ncbi:MAG TPA: hypothetical protein ENF54_02820 [Desulfobacteraceae bacterium]|nr:hypothetical protein [Desulfobacteraceae bacterium]
MIKKILVIIILIIFIPSYLQALSIEDEEQLGRQFLEEIQKRYEFLDDDLCLWYIRDLGRYLTSFLSIRHFNYQFYIIKANEINAFAAPGGKIFLFTGLLNVLRSCDELVSVLCHEIAHVSLRHLSKRIDREKKIGFATLAGVLVGALVGGKASSAVITGSLAAGMHLRLSFSRTEEIEADTLGVEYMEKSGFDPKATLKILKTLRDLQMMNPQDIPPYLLTHPLPQERISHLESMLQGKEGRASAEVGRFRGLFPYLKVIVKAGTSDDAQREIPSLLKESPNDPKSLLGMGVLKIKYSEFQDASQFLLKAYSLDKDNVFIAVELAKVYQLMGMPDKAIGILDGFKDHNIPLITYLLAYSYQQEEEYSKAIFLYKRLLSYSYKKKELFYNMGICYGRENRLALAHYYFGLYFKLLGNPSKAIFHLKKALKLTNNMALRKKIQKELKR